MPDWETLNNDILGCEQCQRLRDYCQRVARDKRRAFAQWQYWGRPVPNFGDAAARLLVVGLAPAAHGANRTGRMFTGDRSGEWLYRALHRAGFANQPQCSSLGDGLQLVDCAITAICHCAPPENRPATEEIANCQRWLTQTLDLLDVRVIIALGQIAWKGILDQAIVRGWHRARRPKFAHGTHVSIAGGRVVLASYHPSQQNTFTGRLTETMFDQIFATAKRLLADAET
jgi:uracil-DNA glycosylase family 4